jgi:hypothetical protein
LEQNFNPSKDDVERRKQLGERRKKCFFFVFVLCFFFFNINNYHHCVIPAFCCGKTRLGYPQLLSGHLTLPGDVAQKHQTVLYPEPAATQPWTKTTQAKRYQLIFPFYPFRTLCPRELAQTKMSPSSFDAASPLFPAHTQLNLTMKRRPPAQLLNFMLPENLDVLRGSTVGQLTLAERNAALQYTLTEMDNSAPPVAVVRHYRILSVNIVLKDVYLQVSASFLSPPPLYFLCSPLRCFVVIVVVVVVVVVVVYYPFFSSSSSHPTHTHIRCCVSGTSKCRQNVHSPTCSPATAQCSPPWPKCHCIPIP